MGFVADSATTAPGYTSVIPQSAAALPRLLRPHGYHSIAIGKWHLTPNGERNHAGPFRQWPLGMGFDRFYGFLRADTNQWTPNLVCDNHAIDPPSGPDDGYHLTEDLADQAIRYVLAQKQDVPDRPFFLYFTPGAMHAPHQVPREWIASYSGAFDDGWSAMRNRIFTRQLERGIVPENTILPERPSWVADWGSLDPDRQRLYARMHEVFAGFLSHTDAQIGRLLQLLDEIDELDNTIVIVTSDNGASAEGGVDGSVNEHSMTNFIGDDHDLNLAAIDEWGGTRGYYHYSWGWAWAGNTPLRLWKRYAWLGGTRTPLIVHWPKGITTSGEKRSQSCHIVDLVPTLLDVCGVAAPETVDGVLQQRFDGASIAATFDDPSAPPPRNRQYFEMMGSRSIVSGKWKATTDHVVALLVDEQKLMPGSRDYSTDTWALFDLDDDFSEAVDVSAEHPDVVSRLKEEWFEEAIANQVFPLYGGYDPRPDHERSAPPAPRRPGSRVARHRVFRPGGPPITDEVLPSFARGGRVTAQVTIPREGAEGVICALGDWTQGWALYVVDGVLHYCLNVAGIPTTVQADSPIPRGTVRVGVKIDKERPTGVDLTLFHDDQPVGQASAPLDPPTAFFQVGGTGLCLGYDRGFPVTDDYEVPAHFTGELHYVEITVPGKPRESSTNEALADALRTD